jgi:hypothetical protein
MPRRRNSAAMRAAPCRNSSGPVVVRPERVRATPASGTVALRARPRQSGRAHAATNVEAQVSCFLAAHPLQVHAGRNQLKPLLVAVTDRECLHASGVSPTCRAAAHSIRAGSRALLHLQVRKLAREASIFAVLLTQSLNLFLTSFPVHADVLDDLSERETQLGIPSRMTSRRWNANSRGIWRSKPPSDLPGRRRALTRSPHQPAPATCPVPPVCMGSCLVMTRSSFSALIRDMLPTGQASNRRRLFIHEPIESPAVSAPPLKRALHRSADPDNFGPHIRARRPGTIE